MSTANPRKINDRLTSGAIRCDLEGTKHKHMMSHNKPTQRKLKNAQGSSHASIQEHASKVNRQRQQVRHWAKVITNAPQFRPKYPRASIQKNVPKGNSAKQRTPKWTKASTNAAQFRHMARSEYGRILLRLRLLHLLQCLRHLQHRQLIPRGAGKARYSIDDICNFVQLERMLWGETEYHKLMKRRAKKAIKHREAVNTLVALAINAMKGDGYGAEDPALPAD